MAPSVLLTKNVPDALGPTRTEYVVELVVDGESCTTIVPEPVRAVVLLSQIMAERHVVPRKTAIVNCAPDPVLLPSTVASILIRFDVDCGVIDVDRISSPSVDCGTEVSSGITDVVLVAVAVDV